MNKPQAQRHSSSSRATGATALAPLDKHEQPARSSSLAEETAPRKPSEYVFAVVLALSLVGVLQWVSSNKTESTELAIDAPQLPNSRAEKFAPSDFLAALTRKVGTQFPEQSNQRIADELFNVASTAVAQDNQELLAETMMLLGVNALDNQNTEAAGLYLDEALDVFEELDNELGIAEVELLRGELNILKRANARRAAYAYDIMQVARWKVAQGRFHEAVDELEYAINENLELNRFGAAAAVYQTLYKGYRKHGQLAEAQQAGIEMVKLHASSGRPYKAQALLQLLQENGLDNTLAEKLRSDTVALQQEYEHSVGQMGQARDYQQLYNYFIHAGDPVRAWQFRVKAQRSLSGVSQRAMHRSQTGVLALLYTSNDHMQSAERSLQRAAQIFSNNGEQDLSEASFRLQKQSY